MDIMTLIHRRDFKQLSAGLKELYDELIAIGFSEDTTTLLLLAMIQAQR